MREQPIAPTRPHPRCVRSKQPGQRLEHPDPRYWRASTALNTSPTVWTERLPGRLGLLIRFYHRQAP